MSSIVPNKALVKGKIVAIRKSTDIDNFSVIEVQPSKIDNIGAMANLVIPDSVKVLDGNGL